MMHRIQRVGVAQLAKVMGVLYFLMGLVFLVFVLVFSRAMPGAAGTAFPGLGMGMIIFMPVFYAILGVVFGALTAALYNVVAGMMGGVELDLVSTSPSAPI
jgi:hypothetical protein